MSKYCSAGAAKSQCTGKVIWIYLKKKDLSFREQGAEQGIGECSHINSLLTFEL